MFLTLLGADLRSGLGIVRRSAPRRRRLVPLVVVPVVIGVPVLAGSYAGGLAMGRQGMDAASLFAAGFTMVAVAELVFGLSSVIGALFADRELLLLAMAPVPPSRVFAARLLTASVPGWLLSTVVAAGLVGYGAGADAPALYYGIGLVSLAPIVVSALSLQVIVLSFGLRVAPAGRARDVANLVAGLLGACVYAAWFVSSRQGGIARRGLAQLAGVGGRIEWLPTAWPAQALAAATAGHTEAALGWFGATLGVGLVVLGLAWMGYRRAFLLGLGVYGESGASIGRRAYRMREGSAGPADPAGALCAKDLRTLRRDMRRLAGLLPSLAMGAVFPLVVSRTGTRGGAVGDLAFWSSMYGALIGPMFFCNALALPSVSQEGRGIRLLLLAGLHPWTLLRAKLSYAAPAVAGLGFFSVLVAGLLVGGGPARALAAAAASLWFSAGMAAVATGVGALSPNFESAPGERMGRVGHGLLSFVCQELFCLFSAGAIAIVALVRGGFLPPLAMATGLLPAGLAVAVVAVALNRGAAALRRFQEAPT